MNIDRIAQSWLSFILVFGAAGLARSEPVQVQLLAQREQVKPGDTVWLGVKFDLEPEWHLYWLNPGFAGSPPTVTWNAGPQLSIDPLRFPVPKVLKTGKMVSYAYEGSFWLLAPAYVDAGASGEITIQAKVDWVACDPKTCVPGETNVTAKVRVGSSESPVRPEFDAAISALPEISPWKMTAGVNRENGLLLLVIEPDQKPFPVESLAFYLAQPEVVDPAAKPVFEWKDDQLNVMLSLTKEALEQIPGEFSGLLVAKDNSLGKPLWLSTADKSNPTQGPVARVAEKKEKASSSGGEGWGSWLQKPGVVLALAALMFLIGLNLLGVFEVGTGLTGVAGKIGHAEGLTGSFLSGGLATVVATPCTAPFMGSAIFYALGQPAGVTLLIFTFLGLGMTTPYLILSRFPRLIEKLPRPGAWMETLKQGLAFPMFAVVIWLIWVLSYQVDQNGLLAALAGLLLLALAAWWFGRFATPVAGRKVRLAARVGAIGLVGLALILGNRAGEQRLPMKNVDVEAQIRQIQAAGKGVFVDFTAAWCLTCQANKAAMYSEKVKAALAEKGVEFLEVDWTQKDPSIYATLQKYGRVGVPLYLLFPAKLGVAPQTLPNVLTEGIILDALNNLGAGGSASGERSGFWGALFGAFLGGLILNLMPCVFPVISLKILGFAAQAGSDAKRIWRHGLAFGAGVLTFFWLLAVLLLGARTGLGG